MTDRPVGYVTQIIGPVVDIAFSSGELPPINHAIDIIAPGRPSIVAEVQEQLDNGSVRCVAMSAPEGLQRGMRAIDRGGPITVPVGEQVLGRMLNVLGDPIDELGPLSGGL
jgi:F-type H+-transporting ATPase subunit beta